jgi:hypothetical protein
LPGVPGYLLLHYEVYMYGLLRATTTTATTTTTITTKTTTTTTPATTPTKTATTTTTTYYSEAADADNVYPQHNKYFHWACRHNH